MYTTNFFSCSLLGLWRYSEQRCMQSTWQILMTTVPWWTEQCTHCCVNQQMKCKKNGFSYDGDKNGERLPRRPPPSLNAIHQPWDEDFREMHRSLPAVVNNPLYPLPLVFWKSLPLHFLISRERLYTVKWMHIPYMLYTAMFQIKECVIPVTVF